MATTAPISTPLQSLPAQQPMNSTALSTDQTTPDPIDAKLQLLEEEKARLQALVNSLIDQNAKLWRDFIAAYLRANNVPP